VPRRDPRDRIAAGRRTPSTPAAARLARARRRRYARLALSLGWSVLLGFTVGALLAACVAAAL
jgi:hypothetical protein